MPQRIEIAADLLSEMALLEEIVDGANNASKTTRFVTDVGEATASQGTLSAELTDQGLSIVLDIKGNVVTFTSSINVDKTTATNGVAEALEGIADAMSAGAAAIRDIAATKYP